MGIKIETVNTIEDFENQFKRSSQEDNGVKWPTRLTKDNDRLTVRFLTVPEGNWAKFSQAFDPATKRGIIITEENEEEVRERGLRPSYRWLAPAVNIENNEIIVVELNYTLTEAVNAQREEFEDKFGDLTNYDISLKRTGVGKDDTKYFAFFAGNNKLDLSRYDIPEGFKTWKDYLWAVAEKLLNQQTGVTSAARADAIPDDTDNEVAEEAPVRRVVKKRA